MIERSAQVDQYIADLPEDRREGVSGLRNLFADHLQAPLAEGMQGGMIFYFLPHAVYPKGYHCNPKQPLPIAFIGNSKTGIALHLFWMYGDEQVKAEFLSRAAERNQKIDMGAACVRFKKPGQIPLDTIGEAVRRFDVDRFVSRYEKLVSKR